MTPGPISAVVVADRAAWIRRMLAGSARFRLYHAVRDEELRLICRDGLGDVEVVHDAPANEP